MNPTVLAFVAFSKGNAVMYNGKKVYFILMPLRAQGATSKDYDSNSGGSNWNLFRF